MIIRKDCDISSRTNRYQGGRRPHRAVFLWVAALVLALGNGSEAQAGTVRLWPSAVVVSDDVGLTDLCELKGFGADIEKRLVDIVVTSAPPVGGTRIIHMELIRSALAGSGANMANLTLRGAIQCALSRPSYPVMEEEAAASYPRFPQALRGDGKADSAVRLEGKVAASDAPLPRDSQTLRQAVVDYFNGELARYGGTAEVRFDRTSEAVLDLSSPPYTFQVRSRRGSLLGLTALDVEVLTDNRIVQTVPLVVRITMMRSVVLARRAIGQNATIRSSDVSMATMSFSRFDRIGLDDMAMTIGQRARRFIPAGTLIEQGMLESVPLVNRGELITLVSVVGGVRVVTTAKATEPGLLGDVVTVRALDRKGVEFDGVVIGPGQVRIGREVAARRLVAVAMGEAK